MKQNAITMTTDNSGNHKQANHRGSICILICICMQRGRVRSAESHGDVDGERVGLCVKGLNSLPGCMLLPLALSSPIKPATPQQ